MAKMTVQFFMDEFKHEFFLVDSRNFVSSLSLHPSVTAVAKNLAFQKASAFCYETLLDVLREISMKIEKANFKQKLNS